MSENDYALDQAVMQLRRLKYKVKWSSYYDNKDRQTRYSLCGKDNNKKEVDIRGTKADIFDSAIRIIAKECGNFN